MNLSCVPRKDIETIHEKTLWVLEHVGVEFENPNAVALFAKHGAKTDGSRVCLSESLLNQCLSTLPKSFKVQGLTSSVTIGGGERMFIGSSGAVFLLKDGKRIVPKKQDFIDVLKLCDASPLLNAVNTQHLYASDIPDATVHKVKTALTLQHTGKPIITSCDTYKNSVESLAIARDFYEGAAEYYAVGVGNLISPLKFTRESCGAIEAYAEAKQPMVLACCASAGMTSPLTIGGTLIQNNAELLAGIAYSQLLQPGLPMVYGNVSGGLDMRTMSSSYGAFEAISLIPYVKALADFYGMPARAGGSLSDAKEVDYQSGAEATLCLERSIASGIDFVFHTAGELDSYILYSMEKQVLDEEIAERLLFMQKLDIFAELDDVVQSIQNVGPGGQFMMEDMTLEHYKDALYMPKLSFKEPYASWESAGKTSVLQAASNEVARRLDSHKMPELSASQRKLLEGILN